LGTGEDGILLIAVFVVLLDENHEEEAQKSANAWIDGSP